MTITYHAQLIQGSEEWLQARLGLLTASEMKHVITPTLKIADNDKTRSHVWELLAQRITGYVEPSYIGDDMLRGMQEEIEARAAYQKNYAPVEECGFITNDQWGFTIGYSPDALVGKEGLLECKSRRQKFQIQTICENVAADTVPDEYAIQVQTGLLVSGRPWLDFISYSGGLPMATIRVLPDPVIQAAIVAAATAFEAKIADKMMQYRAVLGSKARLIPTERKIIGEIF